MIGTMMVSNILIELAVNLFAAKGVRFVTAITCWPISGIHGEFEELIHVTMIN